MFLKDCDDADPAILDRSGMAFEDGAANARLPFFKSRIFAQTVLRALAFPAWE